MTKELTPILDRTDAAGTLIDRGYLTDWQRSMRRRNKRPATIETYTNAITRFAHWMEREGRATVVERITRRDVTAFMDHLIDAGRSPATVNIYVRGVRSLLRFALSDGLIAADPLDKIGDELPAVKDADMRVLSDDELAAIRRATAGRGFYARRNRAIVEVLLSTGVRRTELTSLTVHDVLLAPPGGIIHVRVSKTFPRDIMLSTEAAEAVADYLIERRKRKATTDALFLGAHNEPLSGKSLWDVLRNRVGRIAGVKALHPHDFRHTAAARDKREGILTETQMLYKYGWTSTRMLKRYASSVNAEVSLAAQMRALYGPNVDTAAMLALMQQAQPQAAAA